MMELPGTGGGFVQCHRKPEAFAGDLRGGEDDGSMRYVRGVLRALAAEGVLPGSLGLQVEANVPSCGGLATSAAFCAALVSAIGGAFGLAKSPALVAALAYRAERIGAGIPCGAMDPYAVAYGGARFLDCAAAPPSMQTMDLPAETRIVVACSSRRMGFDQVASELKQRLAKRDPHLQHYLQECAGLASETRRRAGEGCLTLSGLGATMDAAHMLIRSAKGVRNGEVDAWVDAARNAGAYGAKSSGARSEGGCAVALADTDTAPHIARALAAGGAVVFTDQIGPAA